MLVFEKLSQTLAAAYKWDIGIGGTYLRLSACQWPATVLLYKGGQVIGQMANMLAGDYVEGIAFDAVSILNGAVAQTVDVQISGGGAGSNRVLGEVSVINGELARVRNAQGFMGYTSQTAAAGQYPCFQLLNPAGSGKTAVLSKIAINSTVAQAIGIAQYNAPLVNAAISPPKNKLIGGAASVMQVRFESNAAMLGSAGVMASFNIPANDGREFPFAEPCVLTEGVGLVIYGATVAAFLAATLQYMEV